MLKIYTCYINIDDLIKCINEKDVKSLHINLEITPNYTVTVNVVRNFKLGFIHGEIYFDDIFLAEETQYEYFDPTIAPANLFLKAAEALRNKIKT